ncbi:MAG: DUF4446 family protein [Actinomycetes bacterium]
MPLDPQIVALIAVAAAAVAVLALLVAAAAHLRLRRIRRRLVLLQRDAGGADIGAPDILTALARQAQEATALRGELEQARRSIGATRRDLARALRHVAVVRYDAFGDMGGRLSFSAAMVDDDGNGLVLTTIVGRHDSRTYCKGLSAGESDGALSPEEQQALDFARSDLPARARR